MLLFDIAAEKNLSVLNFNNIPRGISFLSGLDMCPVCEHLWCETADKMSPNNIIKDRKNLKPHKILVGGLYPYIPNKTKPLETTRTYPYFKNNIQNKSDLIELLFPKDFLKLSSHR